MIRLHKCKQISGLRGAGTIPLYLRRRRLVAVSFPPIPLNFPGKESQAKVWQEGSSLNVLMMICGTLLRWMETSEPAPRLLLPTEISDMLACGHPLASDLYSHRTQQGILVGVCA